MGSKNHLSLVIVLVVSASAMADDLVEQKEVLGGVHKETEELAGEIADLERVSADRAKKIKILKARTQAALKKLDQRQEEADQVRAKAEALEKAEAAAAAELASAESKLAAVTQELNKIKTEYAKVDARHKAKLVKIEKEKKELLSRRSELQKRVANFESHMERRADQREAARQEVDNLYQANDRLYDRLKFRQPSAATQLAN